jgi:hypothetical protein
MSANVGVALSLVTQPGRYTDRGLSHRVRDAVHAALLAEPDPAWREFAHQHMPTLAVQFSTVLGTELRSPLTEAETALLRQWLDRLATTDHPARPGA